MVAALELFYRWSGMGASQDRLAESSSAARASARTTTGVWVLAWALAACGGGGAGGAGGGGGGGGGGAGGEGAGRPAPAAIVETTEGRTYAAVLPDDYDGSAPVPLIVMLHGYSDILAEPAPKPPQGMDEYWKMSLATRARGIILALPLGSEDPTFGKYFWNATDACCDFNAANPNDIGFLHGMVSELEAQYNVDPSRIFVVGHSNGGFMTNRVACDSADRFAAAVSLAGMPYKDPEDCLAPAPIAMLHVHGTADGTVPYAGGHLNGFDVLPVAPGAEEAIAMWADKNRCGASVAGEPLDLDVGLAGAETQVLRYEGCEGNGAAELWTLEGGAHGPDFQAGWADLVIDFLLAHPKAP